MKLLHLTEASMDVQDTEKLTEVFKIFMKGEWEGVTDKLRGIKNSDALQSILKSLENRLHGDDQLWILVMKMIVTKIISQRYSVHELLRVKVGDDLYR